MIESKVLNNTLEMMHKNSNLKETIRNDLLSVVFKDIAQDKVSKVIGYSKGHISYVMSENWTVLEEIRTKQKLCPQWKLQSMFLTTTILQPPSEDQGRSSTKN